jgi:hypothetical protein
VRSAALTVQPSSSQIHSVRYEGQERIRPGYPETVRCLPASRLVP